MIQAPTLGAPLAGQPVPVSNALAADTVKLAGAVVDVRRSCLVFVCQPKVGASLRTSCLYRGFVKAGCLFPSSLGVSYLEQSYENCSLLLRPQRQVK